MREAVWRAPVAWPSNVRAERERLDQIQQNAGGTRLLMSTTINTIFRRFPQAVGLLASLQDPSWSLSPSDRNEITLCHILSLLLLLLLLPSIHKPHQREEKKRQTTRLIMAPKLAPTRGGFRWLRVGPNGENQLFFSLSGTTIKKSRRVA